MRARYLLLLLILAASAYFGFHYWREHRFDAEIAAAGQRYQIDPALIKAVVWRESRFRPNEHGKAGELGLMQVRETAAFEWASAEHITNFDHSDCLNPATNTLAGTWYLKKILGRYKLTDNPLPYALADYNAGRGNVLKWRTGRAMTNSTVFISRIGYPSTRAYVLSVTKRYRLYQQKNLFD